MGSQSILQAEMETRATPGLCFVAFPEELVCVGVETTCVNTKLLRMHKSLQKRGC